MYFRLLALDLDDTLLDDTYRISQQNYQAIRRAAAAGILVTLATGRMFCSARRYAQKLHIDLPLITYHGALVRTTDSKATLLHRPVPLAPAREVVKRALASGLHVNVYLIDELYVSGENEFSRYYHTLSGVAYQVVSDLPAFLTAEPTKITIISNDKSSLQQLQVQILKKYTGRLTAVFSKPNFLEITDRRATKGQALAFLAKLHGIPRELVAAVGDSYNDLDMLRYAGVSVAVANARDEVKAVAKIITKSNNEHGVAAFIDTYLLNGKEEYMDVVKRNA